MSAPRLMTRLSSRWGWIARCNRLHQDDTLAWTPHSQVNDAEDWLDCTMYHTPYGELPSCTNTLDAVVMGSGGLGVAGTIDGYLLLDAVKARGLVFACDDLKLRAGTGVKPEEWSEALIIESMRHIGWRKVGAQIVDGVALLSGMKP